MTKEMIVIIFCISIVLMLILLFLLININKEDINKKEEMHGIVLNLSKFNNESLKVEQMKLYYDKANVQNKARVE